MIFIRRQDYYFSSTSPETSSNLESIHYRHRNIEYHYVRIKVEHRVNCLLSILDRSNNLERFVKL